MEFVFHCNYSGSGEPFSRVEAFRISEGQETGKGEVGTLSTNLNGNNVQGLRFMVFVFKASALR